MEIYEIDLVRALFANKLNDSTIFLASFYEQIDDQEQISRYVETIKELIALQNREKEVSTYKAMGIIAQAGDSEILNIKTNYVVPTNYSVRLDIELSDRDYVLGKIKALINDLRGRKFEIAQLTSGSSVIFATPTIDTTNDKINLNQNNLLFTPSSAYDPTDSANNATLTTDVLSQYTVTTNIIWTLYFIYNNKLWTRTFRRFGTPIQTLIGTAVEVGTIANLFKMSVSFNGVQSQEPYINNGVDRVYLFFGGNVTITDENVSLGNDIIQTTIQAGKDTGTIYDVEPTEITAGLDMSDDTYPLWTTGYQTIDRNMAISNKLSYSFVFDKRSQLFKDLYKFGRYGSGASTYTQMEFTIKEYRYSYGVLTVDKFYAKLGTVNTQNTNGDVMVISATFKVGAY